MNLQQYIEQLTALMERYNAAEFEVKTRQILLDDYGAYFSEDVVDVTGDNFCLDLDCGIAFVDCASTESIGLLDRDKLINDWKEGIHPTT